MQQDAAPSSGMIELLSASQGAIDPTGDPVQEDRDENEDIGGVGRGRKRASSARPPDERVAAVQEKNRKAQKRFRERQKNKMSLFEAQLQETKGQLDRLREENSLLAGRNAVLEKVLALREEQLKQGGHASAPMDTIPLPAACGAMDLLIDTSQHPAMQAMNRDPAVGASAPAAALMSMAAGIPTHPLPLLLPTTTAALSAPVKKEVTQPHEQWMTMVADLMDLQSHIHASPTTENHSRLVERATQAAFLSAQLSPTAAPLSRVDTGDGVSPPDSAKWANLAVAMQVSPSQRAMVLPQLTTLRERIGPLEAARPSLLAAAAADSNVAGHAALKMNLDQHHQLLVQFAEHLFTQVLSPVQFGIAAVQSHPFFVDSLALAEAIVATTT